MIRAVVDTNIFISALIFGGLPFRFLALAFQGAFQALTSLPLLDELEEKLHSKFRDSAIDATKTRLDLERLCEVVSITKTLSIVNADHDDDRVIECAVSGHADYIITGDRHLLDLGSYQGIRIITVRQFMDIFAPAS